jgi:hypothetical protein
MAQHGKPDELLTLQGLSVSNAYEIAPPRGGAGA